MKIIAFTGPAGSGKSTASEALTTLRGAVRMSFADPIRDMLKAIGITHEQLTSDKMEPVVWLDKTPRQLMQTLGTEWGRTLVHQQIWLLIAKRRIREHQAKSTAPIVFDDCRFDNEAKMVRAIGGRVIRINRAGSTPPMSHISEAGVSHLFIDSTINNTTDNRDAFHELVLSVCDAI